MIDYNVKYYKKPYEYILQQQTVLLYYILYICMVIVLVNPFEHATKSIYNLDLTLIKSRTFPYMLGKVEGPSFRGRRFSWGLNLIGKGKKFQGLICHKSLDLLTVVSDGSKFLESGYVGLLHVNDNNNFTISIKISHSICVCSLVSEIRKHFWDIIIVEEQSQGL